MLLLPNPPAILFLLDERNLVLFIELSEFFEVLRNLLVEIDLPFEVFSEVFDGVACFKFEVDVDLRFCIELTVLLPP